MWNPFARRRRPAAATPTAPPNRVDDLANALQRAGRLDALERELEGLDRAGLGPAELESWWFLHGVAAFRAGRDADATARFEEAHRRFPDSARVAFSLGQQRERARDVDAAFALFATRRFPALSRDHVFAIVRYAYLWSRWDDARAALRPFRAFYERAGILDDHFVYVRGLPFFGRWWSSLAAIAVLTGDWAEVDDVTRSLLTDAADYDGDFLRAKLAALRDGRCDLRVAALRRRLDGTAAGVPTGYVRLALAIAETRDRDDAPAALDAVALTPADLAWLEDVRTLAKSAAARRLGRVDVAEELAARFLARQPLLLEPDFALDFDLLEYQETLKPRYRSRPAP